MQLLVQTVSGVPAFRLEASSNDTIGALQAMAAKKLRINKTVWKNMKLVTNKDDCLVRLSRGRTFLKEKETVGMLGLSSGMVLTMHVKATPLVRNTGALPVFSFGSDGYSYFVAVTNSRGSPLFRHRVTPEDTVARVLKAIVKRAVLCGHGEVPSPELKFKGKSLLGGRTIGYHGVKSGDVIELWGFEGDEEVATAMKGSFRPRSAVARLSADELDDTRPRWGTGSISGSFNALSNGAFSSRSYQDRPTWLPVGATPNYLEAANLPRSVK